jgi:hypothetical protein
MSSPIICLLALMQHHHDMMMRLVCRWVGTGEYEALLNKKVE